MTLGFWMAWLHRHRHAPPHRLRCTPPLALPRPALTPKRFREWVRLASTRDLEAVLCHGTPREFQEWAARAGRRDLEATLLSAYDNRKVGKK